MEAVCQCEAVGVMEAVMSQVAGQSEIEEPWLLSVTLAFLVASGQRLSPLGICCTRIPSSKLLCPMYCPE